MPDSSEGNGGDQEGGAYQETKDSPDERISMLNSEDTACLAWLRVHQGDKSERRKSEGQDDQA
jgi:hypothetical protein